MRHTFRSMKCQEIEHPVLVNGRSCLVSWSSISNTAFHYYIIWNLQKQADWLSILRRHVNAHTIVRTSVGRNTQFCWKSAILWTQQYIARVRTRHHEWSYMRWKNLRNKYWSYIDFENWPSSSSNVITMDSSCGDTSNDRHLWIFRQHCRILQQVPWIHLPMRHWLFCNECKVKF